MKKVISFFTLLILLNSCTISYKFNGASIDYTKTKSISIADFPNMAELVMDMQLASNFSEALREKYTRQTKLQLLRTGGDMDLQGEITGFVITPLAIGTDAYASQTQITLTVNVRFTNVKNPDDDFEKRYSSSLTYDSNKETFETAQATLTPIMIEEICDQIYNDTVAKW